MSSRPHNILSIWHDQRDACRWVLATIIKTSRSSYRKAGAMMLLGEDGQRLGLLSGGCLEGDLQRQAQRVLLEGQARRAVYDLQEDSDGWQQGIGCGGMITVLLQEASIANNYLHLADLHDALCSGESRLYEQRTDILCQEPVVARLRLAGDVEANRPTRGQEWSEDGETWLSTLIRPRPHLLIAGGGVDAQPLARLALDIGWRVSVADARQGYAKQSDFPSCECIHTSLNDLHIAPDALIIMHHQLRLDAEALRWAREKQPQFVGCLGPRHRRQRVEAEAEVSEDDFDGYYCGPVGLQLGAVLPETIALSILAQCQSVLDSASRQAQQQALCHSV